MIDHLKLEEWGMLVPSWNANIYERTFKISFPFWFENSESSLHTQLISSTMLDLDKLTEMSANE